MKKYLNRVLILRAALIGSLLSAPVCARLVGTDPGTDVWCMGPSPYEVCVDASGNVIPTTTATQALGTSSLKFSALNLSAGGLTDASVTTGDLASDSVTTAKILTDSVIAAKIQNAAVVTAKIGTDAVIAASILDTAVTTTKIATDAVIAGAILSSSITTNKIASNIVSTVKLNFANVGVVTSGKIVCIMGGNLQQFGTCSGGVTVGNCTCQ